MGEKNTLKTGHTKNQKKVRAAGRKKAEKPAKEARRTKGAKRDIPFYKSLSTKLIAGFMVPVIGIIVLGVVSYQTASNAVITNYEDSVQQTVDTMQQYVTLIITSEKDEFKSYLLEDDLKEYFGGLLDDIDANQVRKTYRTEIANKLALDSKLVSVFFLADNRLTIDGKTTITDKELYTLYGETEQGQKLVNDATSWYLFGQDEESDEVLEINSSSYCIRIAKKFNQYKAIMLINISADAVRTTMQSLDPGDGGYVALITTDGVEFYSDSDVTVEEPLIYGTDFYQQALDSEDRSGNQTVTIGGTEYLFIYNTLEAGDQTMIAALIPMEQILAQSANIRQLSIILIIICSIIALTLGILISRSMSGTIHYILRQLQKVSRGDLTVHLTTKRSDELGQLCSGVNDTVENVKQLIVHVNEVSQQVGEAAAYVAKASGTFMETSEDIQNAVSEIEIGVQKLDSGSGDCLSQMDLLSGKINNVSSNTGEIEKLTSAAGTTINSGIEYVRGLTDSSNSTAEITRNVILSIEELEQKSRSINKIISAINDIAEQTNLLSLNASIEAARAGDAGKGFAVVAEEIRKLSDQCLTSAGQISKIVEEIVSQTEDVVSVAKRAEEVVSSQTGVVEDTTTSFRQIDQQVEELMGALRTIASNVEEMDGARNQTLNAIESISAVSAETAAGSSSVNDAAGTQMGAIQELDHASRQLAERADDLLNILATFRV